MRWQNYHYSKQNQKTSYLYIKYENLSFFSDIRLVLKKLKYLCTNILT